MVSVRKRKMNRSSVSKATRRLKDRHSKISVKGSKLMAENWDHNATLEQNYKRLGLTANLGKKAGGVEKTFTPDKFESDDENEDEKTPSSDFLTTNLPINTAKLIRNDKGEVEKVIIEDVVEPDIEDLEVAPVEAKTEFVRKLEALSHVQVVRKEKYQTVREKDWLRSLYEKYGDDYEAMKWDTKLNVRQNSQGELKRKLKKWKKDNGIDQ